MRSKFWQKYSSKNQCGNNFFKPLPNYFKTYLFESEHPKPCFKQTKSAFMVRMLNFGEIYPFFLAGKKSRRYFAE
jgi:hypothetical protein